MTTRCPGSANFVRAAHGCAAFATGVRHAARHATTAMTSELLRMSGVSVPALSPNVGRWLQRHTKPLDRPVILIEEARTEIGRAAPVDDGRADDVAAFSQGDAARD